MPSPNPDWKPGSTISSPVNNTVGVDPKTQTIRDRYKLLIGAIVPRPIAFVSTMDGEGNGNLAPYSFFNGVASNPMSIIFSCGFPPSGTPKHTLRNIRETGEFVVNSVNEWMVEAAVYCAGEFPDGVSEMERAGLTPISSEKVSPPRVKESAVQLECKLLKLVSIGDGGPGSSELVIGEVVYVHIDERCYEQGRINIEEYQPVGRLGGFAYANITETFDIRVPAADTLE